MTNNLEYRDQIDRIFKIDISESELIDLIDHLKLRKEKPKLNGIYDSILESNKLVLSEQGM